jgi:hypothetical protein
MTNEDQSLVTSVQMQANRDYNLGVQAASKVPDHSIQATLDEAREGNRYLHFDWWRGVYDHCHSRLDAIDNA